MITDKPRRRLLPQDIYSRPVLPALLVFLALMAIILLSWRTAKHDITSQRDTAVNEDATFVESSLKQRFNIYETTLRAADGLFLGSDSVTRPEWTRFVGSLDLQDRYPGIRSVGFIKVIPAAEKDDFIANTQATDLSTFTIYPARDSAAYAPALYVVPTSGQSTTDANAKVIGFDEYSDPLRYQAMAKAANTGQPIFSSVLNLSVSSNMPQMSGFILFMPLYAPNMPTTTPAERQAALSGFFYAPFATNDIFANVFNFKQTALAFTIYDGMTPSSKNLLYDSRAATDKTVYDEVRRTHLKLYGQDWTIVYKASTGIVPESISSRPLNVLLGGAIFSATLAGIIYLLIQRRTRTLAYGEQKRLEEAKDELLSLASHQLRTPATAVKQYVSMLKDGFAGKLTREQTKLLNRAFESNERQLTIVDDLLYVARLDSGQTKLRTEVLNVSELLRSVVNDQQLAIKARQQTVSIKLPKNDVRMEADPQYLRMIFENLLSNASKYSHEHTKISVNLKASRQVVTADFIDQGVGIDQSDYPQVFLRFSRIPNELSRQIAGSGIGLYLAKQLALLHQGDITFSSALHKGTTFTVTLPKYQGREKKM